MLTVNARDTAVACSEDAGGEAIALRQFDAAANRIVRAASM
jgi:hypothetical protein